MIPAFLRRHKPFFDRLFLPLIVLLVGIAAFGLGRLSVLSGLEDSVATHQQPAADLGD